MRLRDALYGAAAVLGICGGLFYHGLEHLAGLDSQVTQFYAFYSGSGTWALAALGFSGIITSQLRAVNCHVPGCPRLGRFPLAGGQYKVCRRHHPEQAVRTGEGLLEHMHDAHRRHHHVHGG